MVLPYYWFRQLRIADRRRRQDRRAAFRSSPSRRRPTSTAQSPRCAPRWSDRPHRQPARAGRTSSRHAQRHPLPLRRDLLRGRADRPLRAGARCATTSRWRQPICGIGVDMPHAASSRTRRGRGRGVLQAPPSGSSAWSRCRSRPVHPRIEPSAPPRQARRAPRSTRRAAAQLQGREPSLRQALAPCARPRSTPRRRARGRGDRAGRRRAPPRADHRGRGRGRHRLRLRRRPRGPGGLPVGTAGRGLLLLSGGIDSPVAGWLAAKRGLAQDAIFHSPPFIGERSKDKVLALGKILARWQALRSITVIPFTDDAEAAARRRPRGAGGGSVPAHDDAHRRRDRRPAARRHAGHRREPGPGREPDHPEPEHRSRTRRAAWCCARWRPTTRSRPRRWRAGSAPTRRRSCRSRTAARCSCRAPDDQRPRRRRRTRRGEAGRRRHRGRRGRPRPSGSRSAEPPPADVGDCPVVYTGARNAPDEPTAAPIPSPSPPKSPTTRAPS